MSDKYGHVRLLEAHAVALITVAHREWWRPWLNRKRRQEARGLLDQAGREVDLIAARSREFRDAVERRALRPDGEPGAGDPRGGHGKQGEDGQARQHGRNLT